MSAIYNLEPQPTASAIIHTTQGEIFIELWAKQVPLACRNFLQLCIDGYYNNTIFYRLVPGFILQGGDPSGTGNGGESIYDSGELSGEFDVWPMDQRTGRNAGPMGVGFKDEFHSRLKFTRRGLLAMANEGQPNTNGSQFFFTLDQADELNGKNTLFGRVVGDTMYNLIKMGEAELVEGSERPMYPAKITHVEILVNPFEGLTKRVKTAAPVQQTVVVERKKKRKGGKQLLSFGDEEGDDNETLHLPKKKKFDSRIVMDIEEDEPALSAPLSKKPKSSKRDKTSDSDKTIENPVQQVLQPTKETTSSSESDFKDKKTHDNSPSHMDIDKLEASPEPEPRRKTALEKTRDEIAALKASIKQTHESNTEEEKEAKKSALEKMIPEKSVKGRRRRPGGEGISDREERQAMSFFKRFQAKLSAIPDDVKKTSLNIPEQNANLDTTADDADEEAGACDLHYIPNCESCRAWDKQEKEEVSDDEGWMGHALSFAADKLGKDLSYRKKAEEELVVIDPLAKARNLKDGKRREREKRSGGKSGRTWDQ
ncbi:uncharacterized protein BROUX77_002076 [Berkeleyomyces rouxiae]|uniref:uncharacterized protein n=1 Tax=Berkeleyomyces rouxiae TaxID=2035830 RepID=UPI003B8003DF